MKRIDIMHGRASDVHPVTRTAQQVRYTMLVAAVLLASSAADAQGKQSNATGTIWGHSPVYQNATGTGAVTGDLKTGATLTVAPKKLQFFDADDDKQDVSKVIYSWKLDGVEFGSTASVIIPANAAGKTVSLTVTPAALTGYPESTKLGDVNSALKLTLGTVTLAYDATIKPAVSNLQIQGTPAVGATLTATYTFASNGGEPTDKSTYAWAHAGQSLAAATAVGANVIVTTGNVPGYSITTADAGEVMEVSVRAANNASQTGNTLTASTSGAVPYLKIDPAAVTISYNSTATYPLNGNNVSPVAGVDQLTAKFTPALGASPNVADYTFQWIVGGVNVGTAVVGGNTYTPTVADQGKTVSVDVKAVP